MGDIGYRIRNCFTLANIAACAIGAGLAMIGIFAPLALPNISQGTALYFFYAGIGLIIIGLAIAACRYIKNPIEKKLRVFNIVSILSKMYMRLELLVNEEGNRKIDPKKFAELIGKLIKLMQLDVPEELSADEAKKGIENFEKRLPNTKNNEILKRVFRISRLVDKDGFGLKDRRKGNKKYRKLLKLVDEYYDENRDFIDEELRSLIELCVNYNESIANFLLFKEHFDIILILAAKSGIPTIFTPSFEADIEGFSDEARETARVIRVAIAEKIKRLVKGNGN